MEQGAEIGPDQNDYDKIDFGSSQTKLHIRYEFEDRRTTEAENFNDLLAQHLPAAVKDWDCKMDGWSFDLDDAVVVVNNVDAEPIAVRVESNSMSRKFLDCLRVELRHLVHESLNRYWNATEFAVLLLQLVEEAESWIQLWEKHNARLPPTQKASQYVFDTSLPAKERANNENTFKNEEEQLRLTARRKLKAPATFQVGDVAAWYSICDNSAGLDVSSVDDRAEDLLGKSITEICKKITKPDYDPREGLKWVREDDDIRILHVEPVFRPDLVARFLARKSEIHQELLEMPYSDLRKCVSYTTIRRHSREDTVEGLANALAEPSVTFHGAPRCRIQSIVRYGFIVPGKEIGTTGRDLDVRCGSSFGVGIYSSPNPDYAMRYSEALAGRNGVERSGVFKAKDVPGQKLIVCATLMGRAATVTRFETRRKTDTLLHLTHSHVSPCQMEYTVFDSAQILPCYVLHLDCHPDMKQHEATHNYMPGPSRMSAALLRAPSYDFPKDLDSRGHVIEWKGDTERKKRAIKAGAMKWFPYGFGSASGTNFVIEDVADVDDDEEIYGEFQHQRIEQDSEIRDQHRAPGSSWLDQYQTVRKTKVDVRFSD